MFCPFERAAQGGSELILQIIQFLRIKKSLAFKFLLRKNSYRFPWNSFVPDLVTTLTTAPELRRIRHRMCLSRRETQRWRRGRLDGWQIGKLVVSIAAVHRVVVVAPRRVDADDAGAIAAVNVVHT